MSVFFDIFGHYGFINRINANKQMIRFVGIALVLFMVSCGPGPSKTDELEKEVLGIHDEMMPRLGDVARLKDELDKRRENLDSLAVEQAKIIDALLVELTEASESMIAWMRNYSGDFAEMKEKEITEYLEGQQKQIREVREKINRAIESAEREIKD